MNDLISRAAAALERGRRFVLADVWHLGRPGEAVPDGLIIKQVRVVILLVTNLLQGTLMLRAAALTFTTLLAIVPVFAIMFYCVQTFDLDDALFATVRERVDRTLLNAPEQPPVSAEAGQAAPETVTGALPPSAAETPDETLQSSTPESPAETPEPVAPEPAPAPGSDDTYRALQDQIRHVVFGNVAQDNPAYVDPVEKVFDLANRLADDAAKDPGALLVAGTVLFFTTILGLLRNIEGSFNHIWGVRRTRPWYRMVGDYFLITILLPFIAAGLLGVTAALESETLDAQLGPLDVTVRALQYLLVWTVFSVLYYVVPNTRVRLRYAVIGGIMAGSLWMLLSWAYVAFQFGIAGYSLVFSTFAQFPVLLMWIYLSWTILLFGTELSFACQNEKTFAMERHAAGASHAYREALGVRAMIEAARRFDLGLPGLTLEETAEGLNVPLGLLTEMLEDLEKAGLIVACATTPVSYQPARPPAKIRIGEVVRALRDAGRDPSLLREDEAFRKLLAPLDDPATPLHRMSLSEAVATPPATGA